MGHICNIATKLFWRMLSINTFRNLCVKRIPMVLQRTVHHKSSKFIYHYSTRTCIYHWNYFCIHNIPVDGLKKCTIRGHSQMTSEERGLANFWPKEGRLRGFSTDKGEGVQNPKKIDWRNLCTASYIGIFSSLFQAWTYFINASLLILTWHETVLFGYEPTLAGNEALPICPP